MIAFIQNLKKCFSPWWHIFRKEDGTTLVEYALLLALLSVSCLVLITSIGQSVFWVFETIVNTLRN